MGFIDNSNDPGMPVFYNVTHAVGRQCPNVRDDVKLVQYLLVSFYERALTASSIYTRPKGDMKMDGLCGPVTLNWILKFQLDVNQRYPGLLAADNRVDRVRNKDLIGELTGTLYTLAALNKFTMKVNPDAWMATPAVVPLENRANVPPPSWDVVKPKKSPAEIASALNSKASRVLRRVRI